MVWHAYQRLKASRLIDETAILCSTNPKDDVIAQMAKEEGVLCIRGDEADLLNRYHRGATLLNADLILRVTSDCPLVGADIADELIRFYHSNPGQYDYISNSRPRATYPHGLDSELFTFEILERAWREITDPFRREWLTTNFFEHPEKYRNYNLQAEADYSQYRLTVDYPEDLELLRKVFAHFYPRNPSFTWRDAVGLLKERPEWTELNARYHRDESYLQELQKRKGS